MRDRAQSRPGTLPLEKNMIATSTTYATDHASRGVRPFNIGRDAKQVVSLLRLAFGSSLDAAGRSRPEHSAALSQQPLPAWSPFGALRIEPGFVWDDNGRIVGNVSLLTTKQPGRFLVVNVAVHPDYRRRGIARELMRAVMSTVAEHNGREVLLQVEQQNEPALNLYYSMGFVALGDVVSWRADFSRLRQLPVAVAGRSPDHLGGLLLRPLQRNEWKQAFDLDLLAMNRDLDWPEPIVPDAYRLSWWRRLTDLLQARQDEIWALAEESHDRLLAVGRIRSEWGRAHELRVRVAPPMAGQLERPLLAKLLRRLAYHANRNVRIEHPFEDDTTSALLREAGFRPTRTLTVMRFDF